MCNVLGRVLVIMLCLYFFDTAPPNSCMRRTWTCLPFHTRSVHLFPYLCVCVCVLPSHLFWTSGLWTPAGVTQEEGHTEILHLLFAVLALTFIVIRIQPSLSLVDREVEFVYPQINSSPLVGHYFYLFFTFVRKIPVRVTASTFELTSHRQKMFEVAK